MYELDPDELDAEDEEEEEGGLIWEDPREKPRTGATLIRKRTGRLDLETFAPVVSHYVGLHRADAAAVCAHGRGILLDNIDIAAAEALAAHLQSLGEDCFVIPAEHLVPLPEERHVVRARMTREELHLYETSGEEHSAPWSRLLLLAMARVAVTTTVARPKAGNILTRKISYGAAVVGGAYGAALSAAVAGSATSQHAHSTSHHTYADLVFLHPLRRLRINAREFDYAILGDQVQPASEANLRALARWFVHAAPQVRTNFDSRRLLETGEIDVQHTDLHELEALVHWLINLARFDRA